jgi:hypothetical protein
MGMDECWMEDCSTHAADEWSSDSQTSLQDVYEPTPNSPEPMDSMEFSLDMQTSELVERKLSDSKDRCLLTPLCVLTEGDLISSPLKPTTLTNIVVEKRGV